MNRSEFLDSLLKERGIEYDIYDLQASKRLLTNEISSNRYQGFSFLDNFVLTPSEKRLGLFEIYECLKKLKFGNVDQIDAIRAWEFYMLNMNYEFVKEEEECSYQMDIQEALDRIDSENR